MSLVQRRTDGLRRLALLAAALMLAVTSLSAYIRLSQAGLGCDDWPRCYGARLHAPQAAPAAGVADTAPVMVARAAHRVLAVAVLVVLLLLVAVCFGSRPWMGRAGVWALLALLLALGLAVLGRFSSGARLPAVAIGNLLGGVSMVAICWRIAHRHAVSPAPPAPPGGLRPWARVAALALFAQIGLGVLLSASYAGASCVSLADCLSRGPASGWSWAALSPWRVPELSGSGLTANPLGVPLRLLHEGMGWVTALPLGMLGWLALRGPTRVQGQAVLALLALQIAGGLLLATLGLPLALALVHHLIATLLLAAAARLA